VVECWLTEGKEVNEKEANHPAHPMDRMANWCSHGGWFPLAPFAINLAFMRFAKYAIDPT
jgi:hypothetical protein